MVNLKLYGNVIDLFGVRRCVCKIRLDEKYFHVSALHYSENVNLKFLNAGYVCRYTIIRQHSR